MVERVGPDSPDSGIEGVVNRAYKQLRKRKRQRTDLPMFDAEKDTIFFPPKISCTPQSMGPDIKAFLAKIRPASTKKLQEWIMDYVDYVLEIDLQSDEFMLIARAGADEGDGAVVNNAKYQVHTTETFLLIDYKSMGIEEDLKLEREVFSKDDLVFDTFDNVRLVFSEAFSQNNAAEGPLIANWTSLDGRIPNRLFFGLVNASTVINPNRTQCPGLLEPFHCTKIQLYINDMPVFHKGHINWENNLSNKRYLWATQCDMVADVGDSKRDNIGQFPLNKIENGRWFAYVDLTANRKKGIANTVRKIDGIFSARIFFNNTNAAAR